MRYFYSCLSILCICCLSILAEAQYRTLEFIENKGQWEGPHLYQANTEKETVYLQKTGFTYTLSDPKNYDQFGKFRHEQPKNGTVFKFHTYKINFEGANPSCEVIASKTERHYYNYFLGNDQSKWKSEIHPARVLDYKGLYKGIDMHLSSENQALKYDFIVEPGADVNQIKLKYEGQDKLVVKNNNLIVKTSVGDVKEMQPYAYQLINGEKQVVDCQYAISPDNVVTYNFPKGYDRTAILVIDPTVVFATFTGSSADNFGFTATYDHSGNFYGGGFVHFFNATNSFPLSVGAFQTIYKGGGAGGSGYACDIVVFKYNSLGTNYLFATFLGGSDNEQPHSLFVDAANNLVVAGRTYSNDFPVTQGAFDITHNGGADLVISKVNATGTTLLGSTYVGGSGDDGVNESAAPFVAGTLKHNFGDDARSEVILDDLANVYVAAPTVSNNFPMMNAFQSANAGGQDGVVFKLNANLTNLMWSTYIGGGSNDGAYVLALNEQQSHIYVAGGTASSNFPYTPGTYQASYQGGTVDGFIGRFQNSGTYPLQRMTSIGAPGYDQCYGVQVDNENSVYAMGQTLGGQFPVTPGVFANPGSSQFVIKLDSLLTNNVFSTVYGSGNSAQTNISPVAFLVDTCENIYISGWGGNLSNFPDVGNNLNMPLSGATNPPAQPTTDGEDFYFIVFEKNLQSLLYATYMGGNGYDEHVDGGTSRFDKTGIVYQAICGGCGGNSNFPVTPGTVSTTNGSTNCNLVAVKIAFELGAVEAKASADPDTVGCAPFTVNFNNGSTNATSYDWDFGDGGTSQLDSPSHTFLNPGPYTVRMVAYNPNACKERDTVYIHIEVLNTSLVADFNIAKVDSCGPYTANFPNTSQTGATGTSTYAWDFGDGTTSTATNPPLHVFPDTGCYTVMLVMTNPNACNSPDTVSKQICFTDIDVIAGFNAPDSLCMNTPFSITNTSVNAQSVTWNFGDGNTSALTSPTHTYTTSGTYTITMIVTSPGPCINKDTARKQVFVSDNYIDANFTFNKVDTCDPFTAEFDNTSHFGTTPGAAGFTKFEWNFGDGTTSTLASPPIHQFPDTGCYNVLLIMWDSTSCNSPDTVVKRVCFNASLVAAAFIAPDSMCLSTGVLFSNGSTNATTTSWNFGNGQTSTATSPVYIYPSPGTYTVTLISGNPATCNKFDTAKRTIIIKPLPVADFTHSPLIPAGNEPTVFTNRSQNATSYTWGFGDGTGSTDVNPTHLYKKTNTYLVCLTAKDNQGCADTVCKRVDALVIPAIGVPSAFSPNGDGQNDILFVYGAAVETMDFKLFNRWGQVVFETTSLEKGWDGTFKGKLQEMESYGYTLSVTFYDGTAAQRQGNVTLLR